MRIHIRGMLLAFALGPAAALALSSVEEQEARRFTDLGYHEAMERCRPLEGRQKDDCQARAEAQSRAAKEATRSTYERSEAGRKAAARDAKAEFGDAKARCEALEGERRQACIEAAKAARDRKIARADDVAGERKLDANYRAAVERCRGLPGEARDACIADARLRYGE